MKIIFFVILFLNITLLCMAGVIGSEHDMSFMGKGTNQDICSYCHVPHNSVGARIWSDWANEAQLTSGPSTTIGNMCYTCHDGTAAPSSGVFSTTYQSHKITAGSDCDMCHSVHDNTNGEFMNVAKDQDSYCAACHDGIVNAGGLGDFTGVGNHQSYWNSTPAHDKGGPGQGNGGMTPTGPLNSCGVCHWQPYSQRGTDGSCNMCHRIHGTLQYSTPTATHPILRNANTDSWYCVYCHSDPKQTLYNGTKHPSYISNGAVINCQDCHNPHNPGSTNPFLLTDSNVDSQMCINCHDGSGGKDIGLSHANQVAFGSYPPVDASASTGTPAANLIDDDSENGPDYPLNSGNLICETCHSVHQKGVAAPLVRMSTDNRTFCENCHTDRTNHFAGNPCLDCHAAHNDDGSLPGTCYTCHTAASPYGAPNTQQEFTASASSHGISGDSECTVCHNLDANHGNGTQESWPNINLNDPDTQDSHVYSGTKINNFCLSCHDNSPITLGSPAQTPIDLSSAYEFTGHGQISIDEPCNACHEHHASLGKPYLIKDVINSAVVTGNDNSVCFACHSFADGMYPGQSEYLSSEHAVQGKLCIDCHNPHGDNKDLCYLCHSANYSAHYSTQRDKLCVDCHNPHIKGDLKMTKEDEEKLCYLCHPNFEAEFGNVRDGASGYFSHHKIDDEEIGGGNLECDNCHNPHIVTQLNVVSDPNSSGGPPVPFPASAYNTRTNVYDSFCLNCHDGSWTQAKNIASELADTNVLVSGYTDDGQDNLHRSHNGKGFGCQNCHDAHASQGTGGIQRGALLHEEITVNSWSNNVYTGRRNSCSTSAMQLNCH